MERNGSPVSVCGPQARISGMEEAGMGLRDRWGTATCVSQVCWENKCAFSSLKLPGIKIVWPPFIMVPRRDF